jgi:hypothetical protein
VPLLKKVKPKLVQEIIDATNRELELLRNSVKRMQATSATEVCPTSMEPKFEVLLVNWQKELVQET